MKRLPERGSRIAARSRTRLALVLAALLTPTAIAAPGGPIAPCGPAGSLSVPQFGDPPNARNWHPADLASGWLPSPCTAWAAERFTVLTALAGRFPFAGSADDLLLRFGTFSAWRGIQYWSVTDGSWNTLVVDASALEGPSAARRRSDFTLSELKSGLDLYFMQEDNRSSDKVVYRMKVQAIDSGRLIITVENASAAFQFIFTIFDVGDIRSTYVFERLSPAIWGYYSLSGVREGLALIGNHDSSYLNRSLAIYRHLAGIPGNLEPPLAR
jgi:hypothetical protein